MTGQAYEEIDWPARIPLNSGENLASLTLNGQAIPFDAQTGFFVIPKGAGAVTLAHTVTSANSALVTAIVNRAIDVTLGNYKIRLAATGNNAMQISTVSGTATLNGEASYYGPTGHGFTAINNLTVNTTPAYVQSGWSFGNATDTQKFIFRDNGGSIYEFQMRIGSGYNNNSFVLRRA
jgi:hypothetical protein